MTGEGRPANWRGFLRALAEEIDSLGGLAARDALLRGIGHRMALQHPLPSVVDIVGIELEINGMLEEWSWGSARMALDDTDRSLMIAHVGLPSIGAVGDPPGTWLSAVLEGLYEGWFEELPGADPSLTVRRQKVTPDGAVLRYGRN